MTWGSIIRNLVAAFYVLGILMPVAVDAGIQLEPTPLYELLQDIEKSRCDNGDDSSNPAHDEQCCTLCTSLALPRPHHDFVVVKYPVRVSQPAFPITLTPNLRALTTRHETRPRGPPKHL